MSTTTSTSTPRQKPSKAKIIVWVLLAVVVAAVTIPILIARANSTPAVPEGQGQVVRENSRVLSKAPNEQAVLVEFLDYECESCRAAYPVIEELRAEYADTVTFVHRYFPLPGHRNSMNAALAVEAAAQQGQYEAMYQRMYETQTEWGESAEDQSAVFRGFAEDLGLDMAAFDAAMADPATQERIELDVADGEALGVGGTPMFFLDGEVLNPETLEQFRAEIEAAATS